MSELCTSCIHSRVCQFKEDYKKFLDKPLKDAFDAMPQFLDIHVKCKYHWGVDQTRETVRKAYD